VENLTIVGGNISPRPLAGALCVWYTPSSSAYGTQVMYAFRLWYSCPSIFAWLGLLVARCWWDNPGNYELCMIVLLLVRWQEPTLKG